MKQKTQIKPGLFQIGAGNIFASMVMSGFLIGYFVDQWLETTPLVMLAFGALGLVGGMMKVHQLIKFERTNEDLFPEHSSSSQTQNECHKEYKGKENSLTQHDRTE